MDNLMPRDLRDAADACEVYADDLSDRVARHYAAWEEEKGDQLQEDIARYRNLTDQLRESARRLADQPEREDEAE